jgi:signal transduction histidine kinase
MQNEKRTNHLGLSILTRQTISFLIVILVITTTFSLFFYSSAKHHLEREVGRKLQDIASIAARNAPFERLNLIKVGDDQTRMVRRLKEKLGEIKEATSVRNIIVFAPDFISLLDLRDGYTIGTGYALPHFKDAFLHRLRNGRAVNTSAYHIDSEALFISAYAPVLTPEGRLFAIVGVDAGTREVEVIEKMRLSLYLFAAISVALAVILSVILARTLSKPIREMAETAKRLGDGDYQARATLPPTHELGVLARAMNQMAGQVRERDRQLKEIAATVAHEIRNPLNSIKLLTTLLEENLEDLGVNGPTDILGTLHHEIGKLNRFLTDFLTYSRPMALVRNSVDPQKLVSSAVDMARADAEEKQVDIRVKFGTNLKKLQGDQDRLEQSLLNILLNAVHACESSGRVEVRVGLSADMKGIEFVVEDNGLGIDAAAKEMLFEPFFTTKETGTGLGLSNAERIVRAHGGEIRARNVEQGGARFTIFIPFVDDSGGEE